jgi:hypothetical protein
MEYLQTFTVYEIIGLAGAGSYMLGYGLLQFGLIRGRGAAYILFNMMAATLVMISLLNAFNVSSFLIQLFFFVVSIFGLTRLYLETRPVTAKNREKKVAQCLFPGIPKRRALAIINKGTWIHKNQGNLTTEGEAVTKLYVIIKGGADVIMNDQIVSSISQDGIVGDLTCFTQGNATATTTLNQQSLVFAIDASVLQAAFARDSELESSFAEGKRNALQDRLIRANKQLADFKLLAV